MLHSVHHLRYQEVVPTAKLFSFLGEVSKSLGTALQWILQFPPCWDWGSAHAWRRQSPSPSAASTLFPWAMACLRLEGIFCQGTWKLLSDNVLMLIIVVVGKEEVGLGGDSSSLTPLTDSQGIGDDEQPPVSLKKKIKQFRLKLQCVRNTVLTNVPSNFFRH